MRVALVAPSPVPFAIGGAEKLCWGLQRAIQERTGHPVELIKLPSHELDFFGLIDSYRAFSELDVSHFDLVISTKYPSWMIEHENHVVYMLHRLRGLYDTYALTGQPACYDGGGDPRIEALQALMARSSGERSALPELFERIDALREGPPLPERATDFPGPLIREIVHHLDGVGLARDVVRSYFAISGNVAGRVDYFPAGAEVGVFHPPSDLTGLREGGGEHLLTVGRLDDAKRVWLMVEAMRRTRIDLPFKIAGTGPEAERLKQMAAGDPRIELLGFVQDEEVEALYADARAVIYTPYDEDYGLVPFEAMCASKPVITTRDAGGPLELVTDGVTGIVAAPDAAALAAAIEQLCGDPARAARLGAAGRERVRGIGWDAIVQALLGEHAPPLPAPKPRRRITLASTFHIHPPEGGGQVRLFSLLGELARHHDVEVVSFTQPDAPAMLRELAPGLRESRHPLSAEHAKAEAALSMKLDWLPITDVAMPELWQKSPDYVDALRRSAERADLLVTSHPFLLPALRAVGDAPLWYEAQDVEADLKQSALPDTREGRALLESVREVEARCCAEAERVLCCSEEDAARLVALYGDGAPELAEKIAIVPNGVDVRATPFVNATARAERKRALGLEPAFVALFIGSWHPPNIEAARAILGFAEALPEVSFLVIGSVGDALRDLRPPPNLGFMGVVDPETKALVLGMADLALNPMQLGTGTNLKVLEYCAAGVPLLSTPHGVRGIALEDGVHAEIAELADFSARIGAAARGEGASARAERAERARAKVEERYDWRRIAEVVRRLVDEA